MKKQEDLERGLAAKRAAMVGEARSWAEEHKPKASGKSGRKRKRDEPGYERAPRRTKAEVGKTYDVTYDLHKEGLTLEEIAAKRSMAKSTIEGHLARGIAEGEVDIAKLMMESEREAIADWVRENPKEGLYGAAGHFQGRFGYGQLRMVQAWLKREATEA